MSTSTKKRTQKANRSRRANRVQRVRYDKDKYGGAKGVKGVGDTSGIGAKGVEQKYPIHMHDGKEFKWHNSTFWTTSGQTYPNGYAYSVMSNGKFVGYIEENEYLKQKAEQAAKKQEPPAEQEQGQKQPNVPGIEETAKEYGDAARAGDEKGKKKAVEKARKQIEESKKPEAGKPDYKTLQDYDKFYGLPSDQRADLLKQAFNDVKKRYESNKSFTEEERKEVEQNLRTAEGHLANPRLLEGYELQNIVRNNILDSLYETRRAEKRTAQTAPGKQQEKPVEKPKEKAPEKQDETPRGPYKMDAKSLPWKKDEAGRKRVSNLLIKNPHGIVLSTDEDANVQRFRLDKERGIISVKASDFYDPDSKYILKTSNRANGKVDWGIAMNRGKWNKQTREWEFPIEKIEGLRGPGSPFPEIGWALDPKMIEAAVKEAQANRKEPEPEPEPPEPPILEEEAEVSPEPPSVSQAAAQKPEEPEQAAQNIGNEVQEPVSEEPSAEPPAEEPQEEPTAGPVAAQTEPENDLKPVDKEDLDKRKPLKEWKAAYKEPTFRQANRMVECSSILSKEWGKVYRRVAQLKRANDKAGVRRVLLHAYNRYFRICEEAYTKWGDGEALRLIAGDKLGAMNGDASEVRAFLNNSLNYSYLKASPDQLMAWADTCDIASQKARDYFKDDNRRSLYDENDVEGSEPDPELLEQLQRDKKEQERKRREKEQELQAASEESWEEYEGEDEDENEIPEAVRAVGNAATRDENRALHEESYDENDTMGAAPDGVSDDDAGAEELKRNYPKHPDQIYSERNVDEDWGGALAQDWGDEDDTEIPDVVSEVGTEAQTGKDVAALKKARNNANFLLQNGLKIGAALKARAAAMEAMFKATPKEAPKAQAEFEKRQKELETLEHEQKKVLSWFASKYGDLTGDEKAIVGRYGAGNFKYGNEKILADQIENLYGMYEKAFNGEIKKAEEEPETDQNEIPPAVAAVGNEAQTGYEEPYEEVEEESPEEEEPEGAPRSQKSAFDYSFRKRAEAWQGSPKKSIGALNRTYDKIKDEADIQRERETDEKTAKALESIVNDKITADTEFPFKGGVVKPLYIDKSNIGAIVQFSPEALAGLERYLNSESGWNTFYKIPGTEDTFAVQIGKGYQNALQQMLAVPMSLSDIYRRAASKFDKLIDNEGVSLAPSEGPAEENAIQPDLSEDEIPESVAQVGNEAQPEAEQAAVAQPVPEEPAAEQEPEAENEIPAAVAQVGDEAQAGNGSSVGYVPIKSLKLDPKRFQFKHDSQNERGYNEATYRGAKFNPDLAGTILVWRDPEDGQTYVVNGHHRYNLALDNGYTGNLAVRFSPASNAQEAKQQGAIQNIADGNGTGIDVAALLRDGMTKKQMIEAGVSPSSTLMNKGAVLSRLTPRLFDELEGGPLDEDTAMIIADTIPEVDKEGNVVNPQDEKQIQFYERYLRKQYENGERPKKDYVEALALSFAMAEGQSRGMNLFGEEDVDYHEEVEARAKILQRILSELRKDERTFGKINKNSSDLFTERKVLDGTLDADAAKGIKETAKRTIATIKSESKYRGPLNDLLKETVRKWLDAGTDGAKNAVIDEAVSKLKEYAAGLGRFGVFGDSQKEDDGRSGVLEGSSSDGNGELVSGTEPAQGAEEQGRLDYPASGDGGEVPQLEAEADGSGRGLYAGGDTTGDENGSGEGSAGSEGLLSAEEQDVPPEASEVAEEVGASPEEATDIPKAVAETGDEASAEEAPEPEPPTDLLGSRESREKQGDLFDRKGPSLFGDQEEDEQETSEEAAQSVGDDVAQEEPENVPEEPEEETSEEAAQEVGDEEQAEEATPEPPVEEESEQAAQNVGEETQVSKEPRRWDPVIDDLRNEEEFLPQDETLRKGLEAVRQELDTEPESQDDPLVSFAESLSKKEQSAFVKNAVKHGKELVKKYLPDFSTERQKWHTRLLEKAKERADVVSAARELSNLFTSILYSLNLVRRAKHDLKLDNIPDDARKQLEEALNTFCKGKLDERKSETLIIKAIDAVENAQAPKEPEQPEPTDEEIAQSVGNEAQEEPTADNAGLAPWEGENELAKEREAKLDKTPLEDPKQREKVIKKAIRDVGVYDNDPKTRSYYPRFKQMNDLTGDEQVSIKSSPKLQAQIISDALNEYFNTYSGNDRDDDGNEREGFWHVGDVNMGTMRRPRYVSTILIDKLRLDDAIETGLSAILEKNPDYFSNLIDASKKDREEWSAKYEDRVNEVFPGELKGSPKQVDWARKIQKKALSAIDKFVDNGIIEGGVPIQRDFSDKKKNLGLSIDEDKRALLNKFSEALATPEFRRKLAEYVIQEELPKDSARDWIDLETQRDGSHTDLDTGQQYGQTSKWNCTSNVRDRIWRQALRMFTDLVGGYQDTIDRFNQWLNEGDSPVEAPSSEPEVSPEDAAQSVGNEVQEEEPDFDSLGDKRRWQVEKLGRQAEKLYNDWSSQIKAKGGEDVLKDVEMAGNYYGSAVSKLEDGEAEERHFGYIQDYTNLIKEVSQKYGVSCDGLLKNIEETVNSAKEYNDSWNRSVNEAQEHIDATNDLYGAENIVEPFKEPAVVGEQNSVVGEPESVVGAVVGEPESEETDIPEEVASVGDEAQEPIQEAPQEPQGAPAAEEPTIEPEPEPEEQEEAYTPQKANKPDGYYQVDEEAARRAKDAISFRGYDKGSATNEYRGMVDEARAIAERQKAKTDPRYHDKIDALLDKYERKLAENINARNVNMARVPSVMVAGPANFPVRRKEKQNQREETLIKEYNEIEGILDRIKGVGTAGISADDENALDKLQGRIDLIKKQHDLSVRINKYLRKNGSIEGFPTADEDEAAMLKELVREYSDMWNRPGFHGIPGYQLSYDLADINRLQARIDAIKKRDAADYGDGWKFEGGTTRANKEDNRLQIFFDQKPDAITRDKLKQNGFRWSQRNNAWQRQLTDNAIYDAKSLGYIPKDFRVVDKEAQQRFAASPYSEQFKEALKVKTGKNDPSSVWSSAKFGKRKAFQKTMGSDPVCQQILIAYSETDGDNAPYYMFHRLINMRHKQFIKDPTCIEEQKPLLNAKGDKELTMDDFRNAMRIGSNKASEQEQTPETPEQVAQDVGNDVQAQEPTPEPEPAPEPEAPSTPEDAAQAVGNEVDEEEPVAQEDITLDVQLQGDERKRYEELKRKKDIENGIIAPPQEPDEDAAQAIGNDVQEDNSEDEEEYDEDSFESEEARFGEKVNANIGAKGRRYEPLWPGMYAYSLEEFSKLPMETQEQLVVKAAYETERNRHRHEEKYPDDEERADIGEMPKKPFKGPWKKLNKKDKEKYREEFSKVLAAYYQKMIPIILKIEKLQWQEDQEEEDRVNAWIEDDDAELDPQTPKPLQEPEPETPEDAAQAVGQEVQAEPEPPKKTRKRTPKTEPEPTPEPEEEKTPLSLKADTIADVFPEKYGAVQDIVNKYKDAIKSGKSQEEALAEYDPKLRSMMEDVFSQFQKRTDYGYREPESKVVTIETPVEDVMRDKDFEKVFKTIVPKEYQSDDSVKESIAKYLLYKRYADLNYRLRALARAFNVHIPHDPYEIDREAPNYPGGHLPDSPEDMCHDIANMLTRKTEHAVNFHEALKNVSYTPKSIDSYVRRFYRLRDKDPRGLSEEAHQQIMELVNEVKKKYKKDGLERLVRALGLHPEEKKPTAAGLVKLIQSHLAQTANFRFKVFEREF